MPHLPQKPHRRWIQRVILRELEFGGENATFEGCAVWALDQSFPEEDVVFGDGAGGDAVGGGGGEEFVFVEEAAGCDCGGHVWCGVGYNGGCVWGIWWSVLKMLRCRWRVAMLTRGEIEISLGFSVYRFIFY